MQSNRPPVIIMLVRSRKFWIALADAFIALALYFVARYAPAYSEDVRILFIAIQPVIAILIAAIAYEDGKKMQAAGKE